MFSTHVLTFCRFLALEIEILCCNTQLISWNGQCSVIVRNLHVSVSLYSSSTFPLYFLTFRQLFSQYKFPPVSLRFVTCQRFLSSRCGCPVFGLYAPSTLIVTFDYFSDDFNFQEFFLRHSFCCVLLIIVLSSSSFLLKIFSSLDTYSGLLCLLLVVYTCTQIFQHLISK